LDIAGVEVEEKGCQDGSCRTPFSTRRNLLRLLLPMLRVKMKTDWHKSKHQNVSTIGRTFEKRWIFHYQRCSSTVVVNRNAFLSTETNTTCCRYQLR